MYEQEHPDGEEMVIVQQSSWHHWDNGTLVVIDRFDSGDNTYYAYSKASRGRDGSWVAARDFAPTFKPVTDEEVAELFGLKKKWWQR